MKNCDEMVNSLLERRDQYTAEQKIKRRVLIGTAASMCCVCLVALFGLDMWQGEIFNTASQNLTTDNAFNQLIKDTLNENKSESANTSAISNEIIVNEIIVHQIEALSADRQNICLLVDDFVEMSLNEMKQYYGVDYVPDVPADIKAWEEQRSGIYKRDGGTGEVYFDSNILNFSNEDFTRTVHLQVDKGSYPCIDYLYFDPTEEKSIINNVEVMIGQTTNGYYYAEFMYHDVGFIIDANGISQEEFIAIIKSILD